MTIAHAFLDQQPNSDVTLTDVDGHRHLFPAERGREFVHFDYRLRSGRNVGPGLAVPFGYNEFCTLWAHDLVCEFQFASYNPTTGAITILGRHVPVRALILAPLAPRSVPATTARHHNVAAGGILTTPGLFGGNQDAHRQAIISEALFAQLEEGLCARRASILQTGGQHGGAHGQQQGTYRGGRPRRNRNGRRNGGHPYHLREPTTTLALREAAAAMPPPPVVAPPPMPPAPEPVLEGAHAEPILPLTPIFNPGNLAPPTPAPETQHTATGDSPELSVLSPSAFAAASALWDDLTMGRISQPTSAEIEFLSTFEDSLFSSVTGARDGPTTAMPSSSSSTSSSAEAAPVTPRPHSAGVYEFELYPELVDPATPECMRELYSEEAAGEGSSSSSKGKERQATAPDDEMDVDCDELVDDGA
ncbi:hypothetical protein C8Q78DRAFT_1081669 [Trametes maxima]|nr:hypothetical protein C8Q78DRAFT_1081669 [Trametes maxima]